MAAVPSADVDTVVTADGDLVVPSEIVRQLSLVPGQRVRVTISGELVGAICMARLPVGCRM
jgi:bifunctional DNA-binding transcriptional regulator/antitoxin component of YhaV-PrlF toxin-antitoxin module